VANLARIFSDYNARHAVCENAVKDFQQKKIKAKCNELLDLYAIIRHRIDTTTFPPCVSGELNVYQHACSVMDVILAHKRGLISSREAAASLRSRVANYINKHKEIYGRTKFRPKVHWMYDVADQLDYAADHGLPCVDQFVIERIHLAIKSRAENVKKSKADAFSTSVLQRTFHDKMQHWANWHDSQYLQGKVARRGELRCAPVGCIFDGSLLMGKGDVVFLAPQRLARIQWCALDRDGQPLVALTPLPYIRHVTDRSVLVQDPDWLDADVFYVQPDRVSLALAWHFCRDRIYSALARRGVSVVGS